MERDRVGPDRPRLPRWAVPVLVLAAPVVVVFVAIALTLYFVAALLLYAAVWCWWGGRGRDVLFVYSESPVWQRHIETEVLPRIRSRAVVLNWSRRKRWRPGLAVAVFRHFGGYREYNPLAVVLRPFRRARVFRFWQPFRDWKHGRVEPLRRMEAEFFALIEADAEDRVA